MAELDNGRDFEAKLNQELALGRPYEAFQFAQSYLARKFSPRTAVLVNHRLMKAVSIFMKMQFASQAGHLLVWYLDQQAYVDALKESDISSFMTSLCSILQDTNSFDSGTLAGIISGSILKAVTGDHAPGRAISPVIVSATVHALGDALGRAGAWEQASKLFARCQDMRKLSTALHEWAIGGPKTEYPLYFARIALTLLCNKRVQDATNLVQCSEELVNHFEASLSPESTASLSNVAVWHFCVILTELIGVCSGLSVKEKVDIYTLLHKKYFSALKSPDPTLADMADKISSSYNLDKVATARPLAAGGGGLAESLKRNLRSKK